MRGSEVRGTLKWCQLILRGTWIVQIWVWEGTFKHQSIQWQQKYFSLAGVLLAWLKTPESTNMTDHAAKRKNKSDHPSLKHLTKKPHHTIYRKHRQNGTKPLECTVNLQTTTGEVTKESVSQPEALCVILNIQMEARLWRHHLCDSTSLFISHFFPPRLPLMTPLPSFLSASRHAHLSVHIPLLGHYWDRDMAVHTLSPTSPPTTQPSVPQTWALMA